MGIFTRLTNEERLDQYQKQAEEQFKERFDKELKKAKAKGIEEFSMTHTYYYPHNIEITLKSEWKKEDDTDTKTDLS